MDKKIAQNKKAVAIIGAVTGFINGMLGAGGGIIAIFGMRRFAGIEAHKSHATAISVILPISVVSLLIYSKNGIPDIQTLISVCAGGVAGGVVGAKLLKKIESSALNKIFGAFMIAASIRMLF